MAGGKQLGPLLAENFYLVVLLQRFRAIKVELGILGALEETWHAETLRYYASGVLSQASDLIFVGQYLRHRLAHRQGFELDTTVP